MPLLVQLLESDNSMLVDTTMRIDSIATIWSSEMPEMPEMPAASEITNYLHSPAKTLSLRSSSVLMIISRGMALPPLRGAVRYHTPFNNRTAAVPSAAAGKCRALTATEPKSLPAWGAMETDARNNWGSGSYNSYFGDAGNKGGNIVAWMCVGDDIVCVESTALSANTNNLHTDGTLVGTSGSVSITVTSGTSCTVTKESTLGSAELVTRLLSPLAFPMSSGGSGSWTASASFTNSESNSFSTEVKNEVQQTIQI
ncbi:hypothetical protein B0H14DRAFT_3435656 [Mycena olivaceomarginata]|nr:hypothetical protein B0H14DRAFT_3435656 [Mycena olivaceomarginata]